MKQFLLQIIFLCATGFAIAQTPIAHYPFNGNANDAIGTQNGTVTGATLTTDRFGETNKAYNFDGTGNRINLGGSSTLLPTAALTVSAWFNFTNAATGVQGETLISCTENRGYGIFYVKATNEMVFYVFRNGSFADVAVNADAYKSGWHHIAGTYDGRYMRLYLDGQLVDTDDAGATFQVLYDNLTDLCIGADLNTGNVLNPGYHWHGKIDEVKIYGAALTAAQIKTEAGTLPGSGNAISFDGIDDYVQLPTTGYAGIQTYTIECWLKSNAVNNGTHVWETNNQSAPSLEGSAATGLLYYVGGSTSISTGPLNTGRWYHIACVYDKINTLQNLYVNGVLMGTNTVNVADALGIIMYLMNRPGFVPARNFNGEMDEVRIWNKAFTQTEVRERMCRKIATTDVLYNNLIAYYNFDEVNNNAIADKSNNGNSGALINNPTPLTSAAPIGNTSSFDYSATPTTTLTHPQGESLQATATSGSPTGIHVYGVNEKPNNTTGATGTGTNDRYFGVFVAGGTAPQYTAVYNYTGNPYVNAGNEVNLLLYKRDDNTAANWVNSSAALNTTANTLTATGQNTEYLLGGGFIALPVSLVSFEVQKQNGASLLKWVTAFEQNNKGFEVLHSMDGVHFSPVGFVYGTGNSSSKKEYSLIHHNPVKAKNCYRLAQTDFNGLIKHSNILKIDFSDDITITVAPNPVQHVLVVQVPAGVIQLQLYNGAGSLLQTKKINSPGTYTLPVSTLPTGLLLLKISHASGNSINYKVLKQ